MGVTGKYVKTFAEASHAIPEGMSMNADYPLMIPRVVSLKDGIVTLWDRGEASAKIETKRGIECCTIAQSSSFETLFSRQPTKYVFYPFLDVNSQPIGSGSNDSKGN